MSNFEKESLLANWSDVDGFFARALLQSDPTLDSILEANAAAGLPSIDVTPLQGQFLYLLSKMVGARTILEIGTLGGYSTTWLARSLPPGGRVVTLEINAEHARVAASNFQRAGVIDRVDLLIGDALESLSKLEADKVAPFDFTFIDADKSRNVDYFAAARRLSHRGSVIVVDNVVRGGAVADSERKAPDLDGVRGLREVLANDRSVTATVLQTVSGKGYDGLLLAVLD